MQRGRGACWDCSGVLGWIVGEAERGATSPTVYGVSGPPGGAVGSPGPKRTASGTGNTLKALDSDQGYNESDTEQRNKALRGRMFVVNEMIQSEKDYVKDLAVIVEGFMSRLEVRGIPEDIRGKDKIVFGNIQQIYDWHRESVPQEKSNTNDFLKYTTKAGLDCEEIEKAVELMSLVPKRCNDMMNLGRLQGYEGKLTSQGKLLQQETFCVWEQDGGVLSRSKERRVFLFEQVVIFSELLRKGSNNPGYQFKNSIKDDPRRLRPPLTDMPLSLLLTASKMTRSGFSPAMILIVPSSQTGTKSRLYPIRSWFWCCRTLWRFAKMRSQYFEERKSRFCHPTSRVRVWFIGRPTVNPQPPRDGCPGACSKNTETHTLTLRSESGLRFLHTPQPLQANRVNGTTGNSARSLKRVMSTCCP
ncbi:hypothetical protein XENOCAPTIV_025034 [Xenoophorus captivus]|uniref:DH domain-containing protein n=1 Tax=Xenoophorus captivus TaxID=1517983 RepID=A0ABV0QEE3_9TELE